MVTDKLHDLVRVIAEQLSLLEVDVPPAEEIATEATREATTPCDPSTANPRKPLEATTCRSLHAAAASGLLTTDEAAALLHVHPRTVQRLVERGELCAVHLGCAVRFDPEDLAGLIERVKRREHAAPATPDMFAGRRRASVSFAERLRSRRDEHRTAHA